LIFQKLTEIYQISKSLFPARPLLLCPNKAGDIAKACTVFHNFLRQN